MRFSASSSAGLIAASASSTASPAFSKQRRVAGWAVPAAVVFISGCGSLAENAGTERAESSSERSRPSRSREGRGGPLLRFVREMGASPQKRQAPIADAGAPEPLDGGAPQPAPLPPDAGVPELPPSADAGAPVELGDAAPPPSPPQPEPLPRDIVEQSALPIYGLAVLPGADGGTTVPLSEAELWDRLAESPAVCFGEYHDVPGHHYAETRALAELDARARAAGNAFNVGFEMIQRDFQAPLSAFAAGELGEEAFLAQTEYFTRWGYDFALYRPLFEGARDHQLPALALNMRAEITRKIGRTGIVSLDAAELAQLPELVLDDAEHRAYIFGLFGVLPEHGAELGLEDIYTAQTVWDETMADTSARWLLETGPSARLLDFAGGAHCHRSAIPRRITRRTPDQPALSVHAVFESELADGSFTPEGYDVLVVLDD